MSDQRATRRNARGIGLLVTGVLLALVAATVDAVGVSANPGFGWKQITGVVLGIFLSAAGMVALRGARPSE